MSDLIRIEKQHLNHANGLFVALSDPRIYDHLDSAPPTSVKDVEQRIERLLRGESADGAEIWLNWSVFKGVTIEGHTQATITLPNQASIAYVLSPEVWGTGVAQRAVKLMMGVLTEHFGVLKFVADTEVGNLASHGLLNRLHFKESHREGKDIFYALDL